MYLNVSVTYLFLDVQVYTYILSPCNRGARCVAIEGRGVAAIEDRGVSRSRIAVCHARGSRCVTIEDRGSRCVTLEDRGVSRLRIEDRGVAIEDRGVAIEDRGVANNYKRPKFCPVRRSIAARGVVLHSVH